MSETNDIPRWAEALEDEVWARVNELLYQGWRPCDVMRELAIPASKRRSLEIHAEKYRFRRIAAPVTKWRELLARGVLDVGPEAMTGLGVLVADAINVEGNEKNRSRAWEVLTKIFSLVQRVGETADEKQETLDEREHARKTVSKDLKDAGRLTDEQLQAIDRLYGIQRERGDGGE